MGKHASKGYTLLSTIIVLTVLSVISLWTLTNFQDPYEVYALKQSIELSKIAIQRAKYESYLSAKKVDVCFSSDSIVVDNMVYVLPRGVAVEKEVCIYYNTKGNVSLANTITFVSNKHRISIAIQIGGGYYEVREIVDF